MAEKEEDGDASRFQLRSVPNNPNKTNSDRTDFEHENRVGSANRYWLNVRIASESSLPIDRDRTRF